MDKRRQERAPRREVKGDGQGGARTTLLGATDLPAIHASLTAAAAQVNQLALAQQRRMVKLCVALRGTGVAQHAALGCTNMHTLLRRKRKSGGVSQNFRRFCGGK